MKKTKYLMAVLAASALGAASAHAATTQPQQSIKAPPPQPGFAVQQPQIQASSLQSPSSAPPACGWYMRGDIGIGMPTRFNNKTFDDSTKVPVSTNLGTNLYDFYQHQRAGNAFAFDLGAGYRWDAFRTDVILGYFGGAKYSPNGIFTGPKGSAISAVLPSYSVKQNMRSFYGLWKGYFEAGDVSGFAPFISAGIGFSSNRAGTMVATSVGDATPQIMTFGSKSTSNFAFSLGGGISYKMGAATALELAYNYVSLGKVKNVDGTTTLATGAVIPAYKANLNLNQIMFGIRYNF